jgi:hypothetical protein
MRRGFPLAGVIFALALVAQPFDGFLPFVLNSSLSGTIPPATATRTPIQITIPTSTPAFTPTPTETLVATATQTATATATATTVAGPCPCDADTLNCGDFSTQAEAQACFDHCMAITGRDVHRLDQNNDGVACESLPLNWSVWTGS